MLVWQTERVYRTNGERNEEKKKDRSCVRRSVHRPHIKTTVSLSLATGRRPSMCVFVTCDEISTDQW